MSPRTSEIYYLSLHDALPISTQEDRQNRMFYFAQDTWRVTPKLTLSYGVRWDSWFPDYSLNSGQGGRYDVTDNLVRDRKSTRLNSSHANISYAVFCLKKKNTL